jgi:hypothetical protein
MADKKVSELTAITSISGDDLLMVVNDPSGTPSSNKITVTNLFSEVPVMTEFSSNTTFSSNKMTVSANLVYQGSELNSLIAKKISVTNSAIATSALWGGITTTNTAIRSLVTAESERVTLVNTNLTGTNTAIRTLVSDRMQVANTTLLVNDRMQVANVTSAINAYSANTNARITTLETQFNSTATSITTETLNATTKVETPIVDISLATGLQCAKGSAPSSNNTATEGVPVGTIFFSNNHLYIATDATTIKRVSLEVFS